MYSQMHQPDVLLLVKETLSGCCELPPHPPLPSLECWKMNVLKLNCPDVSSALFVDVEADFHARVPVVLCKDKSWWAAVS